MACIRCEVTRAKAILEVMALLGFNVSEIAEHLNDNVSRSFYISESATEPHDYVFRKNFVPPHVPYKIGKVKR